MSNVNIISNIQTTGTGRAGKPLRPALTTGATSKAPKTAKFGLAVTGAVLAVIIAGTALTGAAHASARSEGTDFGNGGDICENRFHNVRNDIDSWIAKGGADGLMLPADLATDAYAIGVRGHISRAQVSCTSEKLFVGEAEKTCKNWLRPGSAPRIVCNADRFMATSESDQYVLVHHEYAGLAGFEANLGESSSYPLSNQITGFLVDQVVKRLAVKPRSEPSGKCRNPVAVALGRDVAMRFCEIPAGSGVLIGSENGDSDEKPVKVRDFRSFQMGQFTVTQQQYKAVMGEEPWKENGTVKSYVQEGDNNPAVYVSYIQAKQFARVMNLIDPQAEYRLPTEAEFEYAARAGTTTNYYWGDEIDPSYVYYWGNTQDSGQYARNVTTCPVAVLDRKYPGYCANDFGLMHMLGNVWQWTQDAYVNSYTNAPTDGNVAVAGDAGSYRVIRGGSWFNDARLVRSANRGYVAPDYRDFYVGFRLVRTPK